MPTTTEPRLTTRLGWFVLLWLLGVVVVGVAAGLLKLVL